MLIESEDLRVACGHLRRAPLAIVADLQSAHLDVLQQQVVGFEQRDATGGEADHHEPSAPGERAQRGGEYRAAERVENDVGAAPGSGGVNLLAQPVAQI